QTDLNGTSKNITSTSHHQQRLSNVQRLRVLIWLLERQNGGILKHGSINAAAEHFGVHRKTISALWNMTKRQRAASQSYNVDRKYHQCGRKRIQLPVDQLIGLQMGQRTCIRDLASMLSLSVTTVWRMIKKG
ncbi:hypothetical protein RDABS01_022095, partial [Bienertia sinuspersici]